MHTVKPQQSFHLFVFFALLFLPVLATPDIVFITQPPLPQDFATANATFGNHRASLDSIPRGGDLYIRYSDGTLKNITSSAGLGMNGFQGANSIAVRDPAVHWSGTKILFSMVVGAPTQQYQVNEYRWQLYEVTGIGKNETPVITKVANQPSSYNNVMGIYGTDERIIFASDRPRAGLTQTYPQRDEYESTPTNTGLWSLDPSSGNLFQLDHSPSGDFHPIVDSFGRVIFTRWDHLQRDQQNRCSQASFEAFNYQSESSTTGLNTDAEVFPEARAACEAPQASNLDRHSFNNFLPWQVNEDGTELETVNHIGRHELIDYLGKSFNDDPNVEEFYQQYSRVNQNSIDAFFQIQEDPLNNGTYYGISAPEFGTHASGQIIKMSAPPSLAADQITINYVTHLDTQNTDATPSVNHIGLSRDPLRLTDGSLVAAHSGSTLADSNIGSSAAPQSRYSYRLRIYDTSGPYAAPSTFLTSGITETISAWSPDIMQTYNNVTMWELQPREIRTRSKPTRLSASLQAPEQQILSELGIVESELRNYLSTNNLALIVSRNVTSRDKLDHQQPRNLRVANTNTKTINSAGKIYDVSHLQIFQGDLIRGYGGFESPNAGRRVIAQALHSVSQNIPNASGPAGSVQIASDGSMAAVVPARQAITYQLTDPNGAGVVRERLWLTFQPGEIRVCASCHGVNSKDQAGNNAPQNPPLALKSLLQYLRDETGFVPGEPPSDGNPDLSLKISRAKSKPSVTKLKFQVSANNTSSGNKEIQLNLDIGRVSCANVRTFITAEDGGFSFVTKKLANVSKRTKLKFSLKYIEQNLSNANYTLIPNTGRVLAKNKLCAALKKSFE